MNRHPSAVYGIATAVVVWIASSAIALSAQPDSSPSPRRRTLDRYCVTCHNDRLKTANLSLEGLDLANVPDRAELWEKVIRKLRAGVMPPPDVRRPPLAEYEALRDFLEAELDRKAASRVNAGE